MPISLLVSCKARCESGPAFIFTEIKSQFHSHVLRDGFALTLRTARWLTGRSHLLKEDYFVRKLFR